jgi:hypothetical protein
MTMVFRILRRWIPLAFLTTAVCGLVYLTVQQSWRQNANDPQIQMAEDTAANLASVQNATSTPAISGSVNINESLAPYIVVYNASGSPIAGNGMFDGSLPDLPPGVFVYTSAYGEDRFTWQPQENIRQAVILVKIPGGNGGFVMAGRSLYEIENQEHRLGIEVGGVWFVAVGGLLILEIMFALIGYTIRRSRQS